MSEEPEETTLGDIAEVVMGQSPPGSTYNEDGDGLPFLQGSAEFGEHYPVPLKWCSQPKKIAEAGDLLVSVRAPVGDTNFADQRTAIGRGLAVIRGKGDSLTEYLRLVIQTRVSALNAASGSGMFSSITAKNLKGFRVDLPPLSGQRRTVDLITSVDSYIDALRVQADAARITGTSLLHEFLNAGGEDWEMTTIGAVTDSRLGKMLSKAAKSGKHQEFPYLRNANVQWGEIGLSDLNTMEFSLSEQSEFSLGAGDVLVCEGGEVGRSAVVEHDLSGIFFQKALHRIRCGPNIEPWFLHCFLRHAAMTGGFQHFATALTIQHLTGEKLRRIPIDLPPLPRQQEIVELVSSADETARATERALESATVFRSSLLSALLSGNHEIPESYDALLKAS